MSRLSKWSKQALLISFIMVLIAFLIPILKEKYVYEGKKREAESVVLNMKNLYKNKSSLKLISIGRNQIDQAKLLSKFEINKLDLKHYNYIVKTTYDSLEIVAEPKVEFLKDRTLPPMFYTFRVNKGEESSNWSDL